MAAVLGAGALALWLARPSSVTAPGDGDPVPAPAGSAGGPVAPAVQVPTPALARDPFRYADSPAPIVEPTLPEPPLAPEPVFELPASPTPEPVRLLGFLWRGAALRAVISVHGTTVVAGPGESAEGYQLVSLSEEAGVVLRDVSGGELRLPPLR